MESYEVQLKDFKKAEQELTGKERVFISQDNNTRSTTIDEIRKPLAEQLNESANEIENLKVEKRDKSIKIIALDLDTSTDENKLGLINLKNETIQSLTRPLQLRLSNSDFTKGYDTSGSINLSNTNVVCNTNILTIGTDRTIKLEVSFGYRVLIAYYKNNSFIRFSDFKICGSDKFYLIGNDFDGIRLTFQKYPNDSDAIDFSTDEIKVYIGYGEMITALADDSVTTEKIADKAVITSKLTMPISDIIPWYDNFIVNPATSIIDTETVTFPGGTILSSTTGRYCTINKDISIPIKDGEVAYLEWDDNIYSGIVDVTAFNTIKATDYVTAYNKHILFFNYEGKLLSPIPLFSKKLYEIYNNTSSSISNIITVAKIGSEFTTINDAITYAKTLQSKINKITIRVAPGIYEEVVNLYGNNYISLVGENKLTCILIDKSGKYINAPLRVEGSSYVSNLTIISNHDNDSITPVDSLRAYAVHCDDDGEGTTEFNNCILVSYQNAAFGCGLHTNQTVKLINCELYSYTPKESSMTCNGALFCHDGENGINQHLIVKGCIIKSINSYSMYLNGHYKTEMNASFYNNMFFSNELKKDSMHFDESVDGGISGRIKITEDSYGNNIDNLNK